VGTVFSTLVSFSKSTRAEKVLEDSLDQSKNIVPICIVFFYADNPHQNQRLENSDTYLGNRVNTVNCVEILDEAGAVAAVVTPLLVAWISPVSVCALRILARTAGSSCETYPEFIAFRIRHIFTHSRSFIN
jgi:hypothetical protein